MRFHRAPNRWNPQTQGEMRFFGGFTVEETAEPLAVSPRTVTNDWNIARAWLFSRLSGVDGT